MDAGSKRAPPGRHRRQRLDTRDGDQRDLRPSVFFKRNPIGSLTEQVVTGRRELGPQVPRRVVGDEKVSGLDSTSAGVYASLCAEPDRRSQPAGQSRRDSSAAHQVDPAGDLSVQQEPGPARPACWTRSIRFRQANAAAQTVTRGVCGTGVAAGCGDLRRSLLSDCPAQSTDVRASSSWSSMEAAFQSSPASSSALSAL